MYFLNLSSAAMNSREALAFIKAQADATSWDAIAKEIGLDMPLVYAWWRRGSVPEWRLPAVEVAAKKIQRRKAA